MTAVQPAPAETVQPVLTPAAPATPATPAVTDLVQERLNEPVVLVPRKVWALLAALLVAIGGTVGWLVAGSWPRHVDVTGVLVHGAGPVAVAAPRAGTVTALDVAAGSSVRAGAPLATVAGTVVRAPATGVVVRVDAGPGTAVRAGAPVVTLDRTDERPAGYLLVTDRADLGRLDVRQRVDFAVPGGTVAGRISGIEPVPADAAALRARWGVPVAGLPRPDEPVWVVQVRLPADARVLLGATDATVTLPAIRPYQLVFGGGS